MSDLSCGNVIGKNVSCYYIIKAMKMQLRNDEESEIVKLRLYRSDVMPIGIVIYCTAAQRDVMRSALLTREAHITAEATSRPKGASRSA